MMMQSRRGGPCHADVVFSTHVPSITDVNLADAAILTYCRSEDNRIKHSTIDEGGFILHSSKASADACVQQPESVIVETAGAASFPATADRGRLMSRKTIKLQQ